jgi:hypothetical protein
VTRIWLILRLLIFVGLCQNVALSCRDGQTCDAWKFGHRRAFLENLSIETHEYIIDCKEYFQEISKEGRLLRENLISKGVFDSENKIKKWGNQGEQEKREKKKNKEVASSGRNVASFGFLFFDKSGSPINISPFHFRPGSTPENIEDSFFFFSGRRQRGSQLDHRDTWTALSQEDPGGEDCDFLDVLNIEVAKPLHKRLPSLEQHTKEYTLAVNEALCAKAKATPFFDCVYQRSPAASRFKQEDVCSTFQKTLTLPVVEIRSQAGEKFVYPKWSEQPESNAEGDFTHSEQYALFQAWFRPAPDAPTAFEVFLKSCVQRMVQIEKARSSEGSASSSGIDVHSYAVLIYSYNVMCVRCAQSTILDFVHERKPGCGDPLRILIDRELSGIVASQAGQGNQPAAEVSASAEPEQLSSVPVAVSSCLNRPMVFMAGYDKAYDSKLRQCPSDSFEHWMMRQQQSDRGISLDNTLFPAESFFARATCAPENYPAMVYHAKIPPPIVEPSENKDDAFFFDADL